MEKMAAVTGRADALRTECARESRRGARCAVPRVASRSR